jgi:hypothetical protein
VIDAPAKPIKETKAQRSERLKLAKNPWDAWDEVRRFAKEGRGSVLPEWTGLYFKWWGIYTQGDGLGATGGVGGEGKATEFFMMRIGLPNGLLTSTQLRVIADLTKKYARNLADITTRQNIQLHWLTIESLPEIADARSPDSTSTRSSTRVRSPWRSRTNSPPTPSFTIFPASSRSPSPAAPSGAPIRRSTMSR